MVGSDTASIMDRRQQNLFSTEPAPWELDDQLEEQLIASVVFSDAPWGPYDYLVPEKWRSELEPGRRVRVPLGHPASGAEPLGVAGWID